MPPSYALLEDRGVLEIKGEDSRDFPQDLITADVDKAGPKRALYGALLTPQGKYLFDFFVLRLGDAFYLESEKARLSQLAKRLLLYKLRAKISIADVTEAFSVFALFGEGVFKKCKLEETEGAAREFDGGLLYVDPRTRAAGVRAFLPLDATLDVPGFAEAGTEDYDRFRMRLGLPDGSRDLTPEKSMLLDYGFDELNGIDWEKGCYVGQEVTARMKHRGLSRKRLFPVTLKGAPPAPGTLVRMGGREVGTLTSVIGEIGLALLNLDAVAAGEGLKAGEASLTPFRPEWMVP